MILNHPRGFRDCEHQDDDRQRHCRLGGGHGDDEDHEDLAGERLQIVRKCDQVDVRCVQHELDGHQNDEYVAARQHADHADGEQRRRSAGHTRTRGSWKPPVSIAEFGLRIKFSESQLRIRNPQ